MLLVGLGNPGAKYANNRHNIGAMALEAILQRFSFSHFKQAYKGLFSSGEVNGEKVYLLFPQTFMNLSGESVQAAASFYKIPPDRIYVFHDELDLAPGKVRIKKGGTDGGHNGLKSITQLLGTADYWRVRMGIGHPGNKEMVNPYVLGDFSKSEREWVPELCKLLAERVELLPTNPERIVSDIALKLKLNEEIK